MSELRKAEKWTGNYRGVGYQISLHGVGDDYRPSGTWCYYLMIHEDQIPDGHRDKFDYTADPDEKGRVHYPYSDKWLANLPWHSGITWYSKEGGLDGAKVVFKAGCDYAHLWDEGNDYSLSFIEFDAKATIDALLDLLPLRVRCSWDGCYDNVENMVKHGSGYVSNNCIDARNAAFPNAEPIQKCSESDTLHESDE